MRSRRASKTAALIALAAGLALGIVACGERAERAEKPAGAAQTPAAAQPAPATAGPAAAAKAQEIFSTRCVTCHGSQGAGDGPASAGLTPPPRNFRDAAWQASVDDEYLAKIISFGGAAVGRSPAMPGNPDLIAQRDVLAALISKVRSLRAS